MVHASKQEQEAYECRNSCSKYMSPKGTNQATLVVLRDGVAPKKAKNVKVWPKSVCCCDLG